MSNRSRSPPPKTRGRSFSRSLTPMSDRSRSRTRSMSRSLSPLPRRGRSRSRSPRATTTIVIERLTKNVTADHLEEIFEAYGKVLDVDLPIVKRLGTHNGRAWVEFATSAAASKAVAYMDAGQIDGNVVKVLLDDASPSPPPPPPRNLGGGRRGSPPRRGGYGRSRSRSPMRGGPPMRRRSYSRSRSPPRRGGPGPPRGGNGGGGGYRRSPSPRRGEPLVGGKGRASPPPRGRSRSLSKSRSPFSRSPSR